MGDESKLRPHGNDRGEPRFRCASCRQVVEAREGTAYANIRTDLGKYELGAKLLAECMSIRAIGRVLGLDKDTVCDWVTQLGKHCAKVTAHHFRNLHITECQLDELWTFVYKKEAHLTPIEELLNLYGDTWIWIAFAPVSKLVPAWVAGKRTLNEGRNLVKCLKNRLDGTIPFFTSDNLPHYADALLEVYGQTITPPRTHKSGRPRKSYKIPPDDLLYAVVCKRREGSRIVEVTTQVIYGTPERIALALSDSPVSTEISTYGVERNNLTIRQQSRRMARKVNAFSKDHDYLESQLALSFAYYHFVVPHGGLRQKLSRPIPTNGAGSPKVWHQRTPAMAAGLTNHIWSMDELLSFRVPSHRI
ncbi:MAG: IS1 family transposase [Anaerolineae bacterium]|nr:IS1 family transposase [Anaerolineae bacterium]